MNNVLRAIAANVAASQYPPPPFVTPSVHEDMPQPDTGPYDTPEAMPYDTPEPAPYDSGWRNGPMHVARGAW